MKKFLKFLRKVTTFLIFIFFALIGYIIKDDIFVSRKIYKIDNLADSLTILSDWMTASASYYDPMSSSQTGKKHPNGKGASGRKIESGSVAMDRAFVRKYRCKHKYIVYVEVADSGLNIKTPYVSHLHRVDDVLGPDFYGMNYIDFFYKDINDSLLAVGRFNVKFRVWVKKSD